MHCNPDICPHCQYIGEGDSLCEVTLELVLEGWEPTEDYMGPGCPYRKEGGKKYEGSHHGDPDPDRRG